MPLHVHGLNKSGFLVSNILFISESVAGLGNIGIDHVYVMCMVLCDPLICCYAFCVWAICISSPGGDLTELSFYS